MTAGRFRIGEFVYDAATGELIKLGPDGERSVRRMPPRPTALLNLLIEHPGELLPRETIRKRIWGEVEVDFDRVLHFCVGQLRTALDDSADAPAYVENLPRRGYRLLQPATPYVEDTSAAVERGRRSGRSWIVRRGWMALLPLVVLWIGFLMMPPAGPTGDTPPPRLAVTAFGPVADELLVRLGRLGAERLGVVGPSTTAVYGTDLDAVDRMIDDLGVDYVLNGRALAGEAGAPLLVELIRARDGVHVWVERYSAPIETGPVADEIAAAVTSALELPTSAARGPAR